MSQVSKFQKFFCSLFYFMILLLSMQKITEKDKIANSGIYRGRPIAVLCICMYMKVPEIHNILLSPIKKGGTLGLLYVYLARFIF